MKEDLPNLMPPDAPGHVAVGRPRLTTTSSNSNNNSFSNETNSNNNTNNNGSNSKSLPGPQNAYLDAGCASEQFGMQASHSHSARSDNNDAVVVAVGKRRSSGFKTAAAKRQSIRGALKRVSFFEDPNAVSDGAEEDEGDRVKGTFIDVEMMKDKVRKSLLQPKVAIQDYYKDRGCAQGLARATWFENLTLLVIAFNALWIAHDTDANGAEVLLDADLEFQIAENAFCLFFSLELTIRFCAFQYKTNCFRDAWFVFDSALVAMMVLETWVMSAVLLIVGSSSGSGAGNASIIRIARLLRLSRMARMARLLRVVPELMILIKGMVAAIRSVMFTIILLVVIMYVFSICLTQLAAGTTLQRTHFHDVPTTMYRLLMHGCLLDAPKDMSDRLAQESWLLPPIFWLFVLMAALTVMNMLVGVLCEVVSGVAAVEKEENLVNFVKGRVRKIVEEIDEDGNLSISKAEFRQILENRQACRALQDVGVDVIGLVDFADTIFEDEQGNTKAELSFVDFMDLILQLRGTNVATVKDVVQIRKMLRHCTGQVNELRRELVSSSALPPSSPTSKAGQAARKASQVAATTNEGPNEMATQAAAPGRDDPKARNGEGSETVGDWGEGEGEGDSKGEPKPVEQPTLQADAAIGREKKSVATMLSEPHWKQAPSPPFPSTRDDSLLGRSPEVFALNETLFGIQKLTGLLQLQMTSFQHSLEQARGPPLQASLAAVQPPHAPAPTPPCSPPPPEEPPAAMSVPPSEAIRPDSNTSTAAPLPVSALSGSTTLPPLTMSKRNPIRLKALAGTATSTNISSATGSLEASSGGFQAPAAAVAEAGEVSSPLTATNGSMARTIKPPEILNGRAEPPGVPADRSAAAHTQDDVDREREKREAGAPHAAMAATAASAEAAAAPSEGGRSPMIGRSGAPNHVSAAEGETGVAKSIAEKDATPGLASTTNTDWAAYQH